MVKYDDMDNHLHSVDQALGFIYDARAVAHHPAMAWRSR